MKLKIEYVDINSIRPYEKNAKLHPEEQIEQIKKSIEQFGMDDPIGIWKDEIVEGHGRLIACKELGYTEVPIIRLDHLTDEERKAYTLAHNKLTMNSDFDLDILNEELDDILNIDMSDFGFDIDISLDDDEAYSFEDKKEEYKNEIDPSSILYIGAVSIFGDSGDTICYYDIDKDLANKLLEIIKKNGEDYVNKKLVEALNDL